MNYINTDPQLIHEVPHKYIIVDVERFMNIINHNTRTVEFYTPKLINIAPYAMHNQTHTGSSRETDSLECLAVTTNRCKNDFICLSFGLVVDNAVRNGHFDLISECFRLYEELALGRSMVADNLGSSYIQQPTQNNLDAYAIAVMHVIYFEMCAKMTWLESYIAVSTVTLPASLANVVNEVYHFFHQKATILKGQCAALATFALPSEATFKLTYLRYQARSEQVRNTPLPRTMHRETPEVITETVREVPVTLPSPIRNRRISREVSMYEISETHSERSVAEPLLAIGNIHTQTPPTHTLPPPPQTITPITHTHTDNIAQHQTQPLAINDQIIINTIRTTKSSG
eukprot:GHVR01123698.1.p1 GENE.GHVR01123698.1~~GHVR01123698.1.p1  ORF type:complete len:343 (-),score=40.23 GHVR01123698.1:777-1805(-)